MYLDSTQNFDSCDFDDNNFGSHYKNSEQYSPPNEDNNDSSNEISKQTEHFRPEWISDKDKSTIYEVDNSVSVFDVASYIINKMGEMTTMKLQKLVYYCQAWSLVWDEKPLYYENIEAWANGPVVRELFYFHRGQFSISSIPIGNPSLLEKNQTETIDAVLDYYGDKPAQWLIDLSHSETPWKDARIGLSSIDRSARVIKLDSMADYYSSLTAE